MGEVDRQPRGWRLLEERGERALQGQLYFYEAEVHRLPRARTVRPLTSKPGRNLLPADPGPGPSPTRQKSLELRATTSLESAVAAAGANRTGSPCGVVTIYG